MDTPTVRAIYENLLTAAGEFRDVPLFTTLYNLLHAVGDEPETRSCYLFRTAVALGSHASPTMLQIAQDTCPSSSSMRKTLDAIPGQFDVSWIISKAAIQADVPMMQICIGIGARLGDRKRALGPILQNLLTSESMTEDSVQAYAHFLVQGGFFLKDQPRWPENDTGLHLELWDLKGLTLDRLIYECPPDGRRRLYELFAPLAWESSCRVTLAGILTFTQDGSQALRKYLESHGHCGDVFSVQILERSLSEAVALGDIETCSSLLEAGVDPNVSLVSQRNHHSHRPSLWNPLARAAMSGNPGIMRLLMADERLDINSFLMLITSQVRIRTLARADRGIFTPESRYFPEPGGEAIHRTQGQSKDQRFSEAIVMVRKLARDWNIDLDAHILQAVLGFSTEDYGIRDPYQGPSDFWNALCYFNLDYCQALMIPGLVEKNAEFQIHGMDMLHLSIQNDCSLQVAQFLLQRGFSIHSRPCRITGNTMLHSALLSQSADRSEIVDLILRKGANYMVGGAGMTILEASLADNAGALSSPQEYLAIFRRLFALGAPVIFSQAHRVGPVRRCLINLLLEADAPDDLILEVVSAGCDVNDCGGGTRRHTTPLQQAIERGRLELADKLIRRGADVCAPPGEDRYGFHYTALQKACDTNAPFEFIQRLVNAGADVNEPPPALGPGRTPLEYAAGLGALNMAQYLLDQGARLNSLGSPRGCDPFTANPAGIRRTRPLDWAARDGRLDMVSFLLQSGGRSGRPGVTGLDGAIDAATIETNHFAVAKVLRAWAAEHGNSILEAEAAWKRTNMDSSSELFEGLSEDVVSESGDSVDSAYSDDFDVSDEPLV